MFPGALFFAGELAPLRDEFAETKIICAWSHDHGVIHTGKAITKNKPKR